MGGFEFFTITKCRCLIYSLRLHKVQIKLKVMGQNVSLKPDSQLEEMSEKKFKKNTVYVTKTAVNTFTTFCKELGLEDDIHKLSKEELGETLKKLYVGATKTDGELYKLTAFNALRYGLSRHIESELG